MPALLSDLVDAAAARDPDREAVRCGNASLSYADLAQRSDRLGAVLTEQGVRPGDRVGIFLRKSVETATAVSGILKAGAAFVPLDPAMPPARLAAILRDADVRHLVTHDPLRRATEAGLAVGADLDGVVGLSAPLEATASVSWAEVHAADAAPRAPRRADDMAYLMYTSGSTGAPKGMVHTHASGLAYAEHSASVYGLVPADRVTGFAPLHFDMSTFDAFSVPLAGATTVAIPEAHMMLPASLAQLAEAERLTVWYSVPGALVSLLLHGALETRDLTSIRWVLYGGEPFPTGHLRALMARWPHARFSNVYGPAEVNQCTYFHFSEPPAPDASVPLGHVWEIAEGLVLDGDTEAAPGTTGELAIAAPTMMRGYWNRPDLDARAFLDRPGADGSVTRFYRTGDLVRQDPDGTLWFAGRKDRQIKTRGYRVELDEVEAALLAHDSVAEAAVFAVPDADGLAIHAAVVARTGADLTVPGLLARAAERVPRYALPVEVALVPDLPRTTSGKADRRALQQQALAAAEPTP